MFLTTPKVKAMVRLVIVTLNCVRKSTNVNSLLKNRETVSVRDI